MSFRVKMQHLSIDHEVIKFFNLRYATELGLVCVEGRQLGQKCIEDSFWISGSG